jgi:glycosyltransferase involved in cell wall biosynthesis
MISVVIEGFNESGNLGSISDTMAALAQQDYPLKRINIILVGTPDQAARWRSEWTTCNTFASIETVGCDGGNYYSFKNAGAVQSGDEIIAFTDSDVTPGPQWLSSIADSIARGADISVGISTFRGANGRGLIPFLILALSAVAWGWVIGRRSGNTYTVNGFHGHNVAFRARSFHRLKFRDDLGRSAGSLLLYQRSRDAGLEFVLQPRQRGTHSFSLAGLLAFHVFVGYEIMTARRLNSRLPNGWTSHTGFLQPLVCFAMHSIFDVPQSYRYATLMGLGPARRWGFVCVAGLLSLPCRAIQSISMYITMLAPRRMRRWSEHAVC